MNEMEWNGMRCVGWGGSGGSDEVLRHSMQIDRYPATIYICPS